jgi:hypothetical protein
MAAAGKETVDGEVRLRAAGHAYRAHPFASRRTESAGALRTVRIQAMAARSSRRAVRNAGRRGSDRCQGCARDGPAVGRRCGADGAGRAADRKAVRDGPGRVCARALDLDHRTGRTHRVRYGNDEPRPDAGENRRLRAVRRARTRRVHSGSASLRGRPGSALVRACARRVEAVAHERCAQEARTERQVRSARARKPRHRTRRTTSTASRGAISISRQSRTTTLPAKARTGFRSTR